MDNRKESMYFDTGHLHNITYFIDFPREAFQRE